jgi:hypothetical protein
MGSLHRKMSFAALAAAAALLGAACASSDRPVGAADGEENGATVEERGQAEEPATNGDRDRAWGGGGCAPSLADGAYCGGDMVMGNPNTLFQCQGGLKTIYEVCPTKCNVSLPGFPDYCT